MNEWLPYKTPHVMSSDLSVKRSNQAIIFVNSIELLYIGIQGGKVEENEIS
jgi:hypothetical protein